jgi:hypothetical protein
VSEPKGLNSGWESRKSRTQVSAGRGQAVFQAVKRSGARENRMEFGDPNCRQSGVITHGVGRVQTSNRDEDNTMLPSAQIHESRG